MNTPTLHADEQSMTGIVASLDEFDAALAAAISPEQCWDALCQLTRATIGARLFTIMEIDSDREVTRREYSSEPLAYPVSGTKPFNYGPWFEQLHGRKEPFVANTIGEIAKVFFDHELIWSLGCGSIINLPIVIGGRAVGTLNALDAEYHYTPEKVALAGRLCLPAKAAWLAARFWSSST